MCGHYMKRNKHYKFDDLSHVNLVQLLRRLQRGDCIIELAVSLLFAPDKPKKKLYNFINYRVYLILVQFGSVSNKTFYWTVIKPIFWSWFSLDTASLYILDENFKILCVFSILIISKSSVYIRASWKWKQI